MPIIDRDVSAAFAVGQGSVGVAAAALTADGFLGQRGVTIVPSSANTDLLFVGSDVGVTIVNGCEIPSQGIFIPIGLPSSVFVIADAAGQTYGWIAS